MSASECLSNTLHFSIPIVICNCFLRISRGRNEKIIYDGSVSYTSSTERCLKLLSSIFSVPLITLVRTCGGDGWVDCARFSVFGATLPKKVLPGSIFPYIKTVLCVTINNQHHPCFLQRVLLFIYFVEDLFSLVNNDQ